MKRVTKTKKINENYDELYICMNTPSEKRKNLLYGIKNALILQDESEKIIYLRKEKNRILNEIKVKLNKINSNYQKLKKNLPEVKNVLSYTEKELEILDQQIKMLKQDSKSNDEQIITDKYLKESIKEHKHINKIRHNIHETKKTIKNKKQPTKVQENIIKSSKNNKLSRLDRIKNNLEVIESKLGEL